MRILSASSDLPELCRNSRQITRFLTDIARIIHDSNELT
nr:MAG TPA: hypothetical protein [Caudoviricetes sp.]